MLILRFIFGVGAVAFLGMFLCVVGIAVESRRVPNPPSHMRMNPLNILADKSLWTPKIVALNRLCVRLGLVWLSCVLLGALVLLVVGPR